MEFDALKSAGLLDTLSDVARDIYLPDGIFYWSGRAANEADINATIGSAKGMTKHFLPGGDEKMATLHLPSVLAALKGLNAEQVVPYAKIAGMPNFRKAWRKWIIAKLSPHYKFDESLIGDPMVLPGATAGIAYLGMLFLSPGDSILCHDWHWENYDLMYADKQGLTIETAPLFKDGGMEIDAFVTALKDIAGRQGKAMAVLNFPNNPTGYMPTKKEGEALRDAIVEAASETDGKFILVFDDAYEGYVYEDDVAPISIFGHFVGAHKNIIPIKCDGATKEFLLYGGRVAAVTFGMHPEWGDLKKVHAELENKVKALIRGSISNCNRAIQEAVAVALDDMETINKERKLIIDVLADRYRKTRDALEKADFPDGCEVTPFNSGFFCTMTVTKPANEIADRLLKEYKVGVIPMVVPELGINSIRIAFCSVEADQINEMVKRIAECLS